MHIVQPFISDQTSGFLVTKVFYYCAIQLAFYTSVGSVRGQFESVVLQVEHWLYKLRFLSHTLWRVYVLLVDGLLQGSTRHS